MGRRKKYIVKKGNHRSTIGWRPFFRSTFKFTFYLGDTHMYRDKYDHINKLYGFSDGCLNHHKNSIRIGYVNKGGVTELYLYQYVFGVRNEVFLSEVSTKAAYDVKIICHKTSYTVLLDGLHVARVPRRLMSPNSYKHILYPYYGGNPVAPHELEHIIRKR